MTRRAGGGQHVAHRTPPCRQPVSRSRVSRADSRAVAWRRHAGPRRAVPCADDCRRPGRLRLTVLGCSTAVPHPASPAAGFLVEWDETAVLLDVGQGVVQPARARRRPARAGRRSSSATCTPTTTSTWPACATSSRGASAAPRRLPVHLPPGGGDRLDALAEAISERPGFFDDAFDIDEYDPDAAARDRAADDPLPPRPALRPGLGDVRSRRPTAPASSTPATPGRATRWSSSRAAPTCCSSRPPSETTRDDDPERGHLTADEAIDLARPRGGPRDAARPLRARPPRARSRRCASASPAIDPAGRRRPGADASSRPRLVVAPTRASGPAQEIVRTGCAAAWAARTLIRRRRPGRSRSAPGPPDRARAGRPPARRRRHPGGP